MPPKISQHAIAWPRIQPYHISSSYMLFSNLLVTFYHVTGTTLVVAVIMWVSPPPPQFVKQRHSHFHYFQLKFSILSMCSRNLHLTVEPKNPVETHVAADLETTHNSQITQRVEKQILPVRFRLWPSLHLSHCRRHLATLYPPLHNHH